METKRTVAERDLSDVTSGDASHNHHDLQNQSALILLLLHSSNLFQISAPASINFWLPQ